MLEHTPGSHFFRTDFKHKCDATRVTASPRRGPLRRGAGPRGARHKICFRWAAADTYSGGVYASTSINATRASHICRLAFAFGGSDCHQVEDQNACSPWA